MAHDRLSSLMSVPTQNLKLITTCEMTVLNLSDLSVRIVFSNGLSQARIGLERSREIEKLRDHSGGMYRIHI